MLGAYGIPLVESLSAADAEGAGAAAHRLGGSVVLKAVAPTLVHKSEAHAVRVGLEGLAEVTNAAREMADEVERAGHALSGFLVQRQIDAPAVEMLVGMTHDPDFGPLLACGAGGTTAELLKDVAVRLTPIDDRDASEMVRSLRTFPLLDGYRGAASADVDALEDILLRLSALVEAHPEIVELDLNPVMVAPDTRGGGRCPRPSWPRLRSVRRGRPCADRLTNRPTACRTASAPPRRRSRSGRSRGDPSEGRVCRAPPAPSLGPVCRRVSTEPIQRNTRMTGRPSTQRIRRTEFFLRSHLKGAPNVQVDCLGDRRLRVGRPGAAVRQVVRVRGGRDADRPPLHEILVGRGGGQPVVADEDDVTARIEGQVRELGDEGLKATLRVVHATAGSVPQTIADAADDLSADLIVVGTRGHTAFGGLLLGSVTQRLLHVATCPVFAVPAAAQPPALSGSEAAQATAAV